jgi:hypothetical protein
MSQDRDQWQIEVNTAMKLIVIQKAGNFLPTWSYQKVGCSVDIVTELMLLNVLGPED